jgi:hypothetical protein
LSGIDDKKEANEDMAYFKLKNEGGIESLMYIAFFQQRPKQEGVKMIRGVEDASLTNQNKITEVKDELVDCGYMQQSYIGEGNRVLALRSHPKPVIRYIKERMEARKAETNKENPDYYNVLKREQDALLLIIDSVWFRKAVYKFVDSRRVDKKRLTSIDIAETAMKCIGTTFDEVSVFARVFSNVPLFKSNMPQFEDLANQNSFDSFASDWVKNHFKDKLFNEFINDCISSHELDFYPENKKNRKPEYSKQTNKSNVEINNMTKERIRTYIEGLYPLCMPLELVSKFNLIVKNNGSIQDKLRNGIDYSLTMKKYRKFREGYNAF